MRCQRMVQDIEGSNQHEIADVGETKLKIERQ